MDRLRTYRSPLIMALVAMVAHVLMAFVPATAAPDPGMDMTLEQALMVVCTMDGAKTDGTVSHDACTHCTLCASVAAKTPLLPLLAVAYPTAPQDIWRYADHPAPSATPAPYDRPFAQGPPIQSPITL